MQSVNFLLENGLAFSSSSTTGIQRKWHSLDFPGEGIKRSVLPLCSLKYWLLKTSATKQILYLPSHLMKCEKGQIRPHGETTWRGPVVTYKNWEKERAAWPVSRYSSLSCPALPPSPTPTLVQFQPSTREKLWEPRLPRQALPRLPAQRMYTT